MTIDVHIENRTPFDVKPAVVLDADGREVLLMLLSASFDISPDGTLVPAADPLPVTHADIPRGDPALSSLWHEADIAPVKPRRELILNATAHAPDGRAVTSLLVGVQAGDIRKLLRVTGDRHRTGVGLGDPEPFTEMPICWERAFGGTDADGDCLAENPVGIGYGGAVSANPDVTSHAPNIGPGDLAPDAVADRPAGFGVVGRGWRPRIRLAGTYDDAWMADQWPFPPLDMQDAYHMAAPRDQQSDALRAGMEVTLLNLVPGGGRLRFALPRITAPVRLIRDTSVEEARFQWDTVIVEPDRMRVTVKARMPFVTRRGLPKLREVLFGHLSPVFVRSRAVRKAYLNPRGGDGTLPAPLFEVT